MTSRHRTYAAAKAVDHAGCHSWRISKVFGTKCARATAITSIKAKLIEPTLQSYRRDLRKATRFVLDGDFIRYVTELSSTTRPEKLLARLQYATLPYETTWIEFDLREKVRVMRTVHGLDIKDFDWSYVAERLGLIIRRLSHNEWVCEMVCETHDDYGLIGTTICYFFSVHGYTFTAQDGKGTGCRQFSYDEPQAGLSSAELEAVRHVGSASLWGYSTSTYRSTMVEKLEQMRTLALPGYLLRHGVLGTGRMKVLLDALIPAAGKKPVHDTIAKLMLQETTEFTGMMRWVVCVLACLNEVPISTQRIAREGTVRTGLTTRRPLMDYHKVTIRVPKKNPVKYLERQLSPGRRRRAHMVRSHWRNYLHDDHCAYDMHQWEYDEEHDYRMCGRCMSYSSLIPEHQRGDISLGWVRSDYVVKKSDE